MALPFEALPSMFEKPDVIHTLNRTAIVHRKRDHNISAAGFCGQCTASSATEKYEQLELVLKDI
jgi:hypothetical protein